MNNVPTVYLVIENSAIAFEESGEILETVDWVNGSPDWTNAGICDHRGAGGFDGFRLLFTALTAATENATLCGYDIERVPRDEVTA